MVNVEKEELAMALGKAQKLSQKSFGKRIRFYAPSFVYYKSRDYSSSPAAFPSISVTASSCSLNCKHCGSTVLNTMYPATSPGRLLELCKDLKSKGAVGCLISGGCISDGSVPLEGFVDTMAEVKRELGLTLVVHTGVVGRDMAKQLSQAGVDAALIDVIGSDETIREICHLNLTVRDYEKSLQALREAEVPMVPHILVGLHYGQVVGEFRALEIVAGSSPSAVIIIVFMPIRGTAMEQVAPPDPSDIGKVLAAARFMMPRTPLVLGCMRPKDPYRAKVDVIAVRAGVNAIAFPAEEAVELAKSLGYEISFSSLCCSQIFSDLKDERVQT